jgi:hypothetical protein
MRANRGKACGLLILVAIFIVIGCTDGNKERSAELQPKIVDEKIVWQKNGGPYTGTWKHENIEVYFESGIEIEKILQERINDKIWCRERYMNGELVEKEWLDSEESVIRNASKMEGEPFTYVYFRETYSKIRKGDLEETVIKKQEISGFEHKWELKNQ